MHLSRPWAGSVLLLSLSAVTLAAPTTRPAKPRDPATLPPGTLPLKEETIRKERDRLREAVAKFTDEVAKAEAQKGGTTPQANKKGSPGPAVLASATKGDDPASVERENQQLRNEADALLLRLATAEGKVPTRPATYKKPFNPRIQVAGDAQWGLCPGLDVAELEKKLHFAGTPIGETDDGQVVYEWVGAGTGPDEQNHTVVSMLARAKDRMVTGVAFKQQRVVLGPPPERPSPERQPGERLLPDQPGTASATTPPAERVTKASAKSPAPTQTRSTRKPRASSDVRY